VFILKVELMINKFFPF